MTAPHQDPKVQPIPTPLTLAEQQYREALSDLTRDASDAPLLPWRSAIELIGPLLPGQLWVVGARPGNGKTTFLLNVLDWMVCSRQPTLYLTTETKAAEMRRLWAALQLGYSASDVLENAWQRLPSDARAQIAQRLEWQTYAAADVALFVDLPRLDTAHVARVLKEYAIEAKYPIVILDHVHRWQVRELSEKTAELTEAVQRLKGAAATYGLTLLLAAQINRGQDRSPLAEFLPPPLSALKQTGALEEEANVVLMLHRARRKDATKAMAQEVAMGQRDIRDLLDPDIICVSVAKHRNRPHATGRMLRLRVLESCQLDPEFGARALGREDPDAPRRGDAWEPEPAE